MACRHLATQTYAIQTIEHWRWESSLPSSRKEVMRFSCQAYEETKCTRGSVSEIEGKCVRFLCVRYKIMRPIQRMSKAGRGHGGERDEGGGAGRGRIYRLSRDLRTLAKRRALISLTGTRNLRDFKRLPAFMQLTGACEHYGCLRALRMLANITGACEHYGRLQILQEFAIITGVCENGDGT